MRGSDTVQIRKRSTTVTRDRLNKKVAADDVLITKTGCLFEIQRDVEALTLTTIDSDVAFVFLPVDDDTRAIKSIDAIDFDGRTYEMRGPRAIERRLDGTEVQVWCTVQCEVA
jgi:hypothetical protein